ECMFAQTAAAIDQNQRWRSLHCIGCHGLRNGAARPRAIDADGKSQTILTYEHLEGLGPHHIVMFKYGVNADDGEMSWVKGAFYALDLGETARHTSRAQHLEGMEYDDLSSQLLQGQLA